MEWACHSQGGRLTYTNFSGLPHVPNDVEGEALGRKSGLPKQLLAMFSADESGQGTRSQTVEVAGGMFDDPWTGIASFNEFEGYQPQQTASTEIHMPAPLANIATSALEANTECHVQPGWMSPPAIQLTRQGHNRESATVRFRCCYPKCSSTLANRKTCRQHMQKIHLEPKAYNCCCGFKTRHKGGWKQHMLDCTSFNDQVVLAPQEKQEIYKCPITGRQFDHTQKNEFINHLVNCSMV